MMPYTARGMEKDEPGGQSDPLIGRFPSAGRGPWAQIPDHEWNDWRWQLRNRLTTLEQLEKLMPLTKEERLGVQLAGHHLALAITPYFFNLIDVNDPDCPIRRQVVPRVEETQPAPWESIDPLSDDENMVVRGRVNRGPVRGALPVLYAQSRGERSGGTATAHAVHRGDQLHPGTHRSARRVAQRRRSVVVQRRATRTHLESAPRNQAC